MRCISTVRFKKSAQAHKTNRSCVPDCFSGKNKGQRLHVALNVDNAPITCTVLVSSHPMGRQTGPGPLSPALRITYWTVSLDRAAPRCNFHLSNKCYRGKVEHCLRCELKGCVPWMWMQLQMLNISRRSDRTLSTSFIKKSINLSPSSVLPIECSHCAVKLVRTHQCKMADSIWGILKFYLWTLGGKVGAHYLSEVILVPARLHQNLMRRISRD